LPLRTKSQKEQAIRNRFHVRLEEGLDKLNAGLDKKVPPKTTRKYLNASVGCAKKTAASLKTTVLKSLPMPTKTTPSALNGSVNSKAIKKISTAVSTA